MNIKFDGIAGPAAGKLTMACNRLQPMVHRCVVAMTPGHINWGAYRRWLDVGGNTNRQNVEFVRRVVHTVYTWTQTKTFTFANVEGSALHQWMPGLCAYVLAPTQHMRAGGGLGATRFGGLDHVGSGVRILLPPSTTANTNELIMTVFHEITHKVGFRIVDTQPRPYDPAQCQDRAQNAPQTALRNAENYTLFFAEVNGL